MRSILVLGMVASFLTSSAIAEPPAMVGGKLVGNVPKIDYSQIRKIPKIDYDQPGNWLCGPDSPSDACLTGLDAELPVAAGTKKIEHFIPSADPPVDCFYVYPTSSVDAGAYSDLDPDAEIVSTREQFGRLASVCRPFVPMYHQLTSWTLVSLEDKNPGSSELQLKDPHAMDLPYRDIRAAWKYYLEHYNKGRGVVLVSHSAGSILTTRLLAEEVDGKATQKQLVSAFIAGGLGVDKGTFKSIAPCGSRSQTGCVIAWATYRDLEVPKWRYLGRARPGIEPLCVDPAQIDGSFGKPIAYLPRPQALAQGGPEFIKVIGEAQTECIADERGAVIRVKIKTGSEIERIATELTAAWGEFPPIYGLHEIDIALFQGNIINLISSQAAAWERERLQRGFPRAL